MALALDWTRMMPSLPYKLDRIMDLGLLVFMAIWEAIKEKVLHASAPQAPYVSTAKGVQRHPNSEHLASYLECFGIYHYYIYTSESIHSSNIYC